MGKVESVKSVVELDLDFVVAVVTFRIALASNSPRFFFFTFLQWKTFLHVALDPEF